MLQNGNVETTQVNVSLLRDGKGFWAFCPITLQLIIDDVAKEKVEVTTDSQGKVSFPLVMHQDNESLDFIVRGNKVYNLHLTPETDTSDIQIIMA